MDWSFEDFMEKVEAQSVPAKKIQLTTKPDLANGTGWLQTSLFS